MTERRLIEFLEEEVPRTVAEEVAAAEAREPELAARLRELRTVVGRLRAAPPWIAEIDLTEEIRAAIDRLSDSAAAAGRVRRSGWPVPMAISAAAGLAVVAAVAAVTFAWSSGSARSDADEFRRKGVVAGRGAEAPAAADRWVGVQIYRARAGAPPRRLAGGAAGDSTSLDGSLRASDGLLFAYTNLGPAPLDYVMLFGVDQSGAVHWFYPAYERRDQDPVGVPAAAGVANAELPDRIEHPFTPGPLIVYGLFTAHPLRVSEVEAAVRDLFVGGEWSVDAPPRLRLPGSGQHAVRLDVIPGEGP